MPTIKDIAKEAGVSVSTASRALNDNERISLATRQRVQKIAKQLGYQPNYTARNLTRGEANMVGLVFPVTSDTAPANPFHIDLMRGVSQAVQPLHYEMVVAIAPTQEDLLDEVKSMVTQSKVHNFLVFYTMKDDPVTKYLRDQGLNYVVIGHPQGAYNERFVDNDNMAAGKAATDYIVNHYQPHQVAFVESYQPWQFEQDRAAGYQQSMREHDLPKIVWQLADNVRSLKDYFDEHSQVDALVFSDDLLFVRFVQEVQQYQLPVICFNNSRLMRMLTHCDERVDLQPRELGRQAIKLLFDHDRQHQIVDFKVEY